MKAASAGLVGRVVLGWWYATMHERVTAWCRVAQPNEQKGQADKKPKEESVKFSSWLSKVGAGVYTVMMD